MPCAKAHEQIKELLNNNDDIQLQILFMSRPDEYKAPPIRHFLAITEFDNNKQTISQALDDWYFAEKKDYDAFAAKYPMNGELIKQDEKIEAMYEWCSKTEITFTPTLFVDGRQLPPLYSVDDLKYFLST
jgi:protein-disulfide isomerase